MLTLLRRFMLPQRIPLQMKLTKRCPHPNCRHLLIQPDTKTTRFKIKTVALNYIPIIEVGRRRRRIASGDLGQPKTAEEVEQRRRERRRTRPGGKDEDEDMGKIIRGGVDVSLDSEP
jgi:dynactin-4